MILIFESAIFLHCYLLFSSTVYYNRSINYSVRTLELSTIKNSRRVGTWSTNSTLIDIVLVHLTPLRNPLLTRAYVSSLCYCVCSFHLYNCKCLHVKIMFFSLGLAPSSFIFPVQSIFLAVTSEAEFLDETQTKVFRVFLHAIHNHLY